MTSYDETAGAEDPVSLLRGLSRSIELEETGDDMPEGLTVDEMWGEEHLRGVGSQFSAVVGAAADLLIEPQELRSEARARMIAAVGRVLSERRKANGLLPVLLRSVREGRSMTLAEVAAEANMSEDQIRDLESGDAAVAGLGVETTVAWIRSLPVEPSVAIASLRRSLRVGSTGELTLAASATERPRDVEDYVRRVESRLNAHSEEDES